MDWPLVAVLVVTYQRHDVLRETLLRLQTFLHYSGMLTWIVADDGSTDGTQALVQSIPFGLVVSERQGLGANTNAGLDVAFAQTDLVLQLQDDLWLQQPLDLDPHVRKLVDDPTAGFIRLWGVGGHKYHARLDGSYWHVAWDSPELYIPSDRPHLKHKRFHERFGLYPTGLKTGDTEEVYCHHCKDTGGLPEVIVPQSMNIEPMWEHVGWNDRWRDKGL